MESSCVIIADNNSLVALLQNAIIFWRLLPPTCFDYRHPSICGCVWTQRADITIQILETNKSCPPLHMHVTSLHSNIHHGSMSLHMI